jgi:hypothetical protein
VIAALLLSLAVASPQRTLEPLVAQGRLDEAEEGYRAWIETDPGSVDALLGLSRILRWTARLLESRDLAARAVALAPARPDAREELARTYAAEGLPDEAGGALSRPAPDDLRVQMEKLRRISLTLSSTMSDDSNGVTTAGPRLAVAVPLQHDAVLTVATGVTHVVQGGAALDHRLAGMSLRIPFERISLTGGYVLHQGYGTISHEGEGGIAVHAADGFALALSARHRPFIQTADSLATDESTFYAAGAGGALHPDEVQWLSVDEAKMAIQVAPARSMFGYAEGRILQTGDSNRAWSTAAGIGLEVLRLFHAHAPVEAYLRWDAYFTGFQFQRTAYFSPGFQDGHSPGLDLRLHLGESVTLGAEGGRTFAMLADARAGWFGGGHAEVRTGRMSFSVHAQVRDDPWYGSTRIWAALQSDL